MGPRTAVTSSAIMGGILGWAIWYLCGDREQQNAILPLAICAGGVLGAVVAAASEIVQAIDRCGMRFVETVEKHLQTRGEKGLETGIKSAGDVLFGDKR